MPFECYLIFLNGIAPVDDNKLSRKVSIRFPNQDLRSISSALSRYTKDGLLVREELDPKTSKYRLKESPCKRGDRALEIESK